MKKTFMTLMFLIFFITSAGYAIAGSSRYTKRNNAFAVTEGSLERAQRYAKQNRFSDLQSMVDSGTVYVFKENVRMEVIDRKWLDGKVKVRPIGSDIELWTFDKSLKMDTK